MSGTVRPGPAGVAIGTISTRRIDAAVGLAAGVTGLAAPMAAAAERGIPEPAQPVATLDPPAVSDIPAEHKDEIPRPSRARAQSAEARNWVAASSA
ncbi:hypothetical protein [Streptomyces afghaniensis]|uniref:hypothetical protein n=1 Tax=Streptomyces afghaniensis TaxID=66865 RepID=UPI002780A34C|nr:hypothetical protein [Streptomyces afghaniensis]MDQ1021905.1 hypothetical protein [Streptomyces afghaniensis]